LQWELQRALSTQQQQPGGNYNPKYPHPGGNNNPQQQRGTENNRNGTNTAAATTIGGKKDKRADNQCQQINGPGHDKDKDKDKDKADHENKNMQKQKQKQKKEKKEEEEVSHAEHIRQFQQAEIARLQGTVADLREQNKGLSLKLADARAYPLYNTRPPPEEDTGAEKLNLAEEVELLFHPENEHEEEAYGETALEREKREEEEKREADLRVERAVNMSAAYRVKLEQIRKARKKSQHFKAMRALRGQQQEGEGEGEEG
jgi:hypothetical protein